MLTSDNLFDGSFLKYESVFKRGKVLKLLLYICTSFGMIFLNIKNTPVIMKLQIFFSDIFILGLAGVIYFVNLTQTG